MYQWEEFNRRPNRYVWCWILFIMAIVMMVVSFSMQTSEENAYELQITETVSDIESGKITSLNTLRQMGYTLSENSYIGKDTVYLYGRLGDYHITVNGDPADIKIEFAGDEFFSTKFLLGLMGVCMLALSTIVTYFTYLKEKEKKSYRYYH